jgi:hypothetical protein
MPVGVAVNPVRAPILSDGFRIMVLSVVDGDPETVEMISGRTVGGEKKQGKPPICDRRFPPFGLVDSLKQLFVSGVFFRRRFRRFVLGRGLFVHLR